MCVLGTMNKDKIPCLPSEKAPKIWPNGEDSVFLQHQNDKNLFEDEKKYSFAALRRSAGLMQHSGPDGSQAVEPRIGIRGALCQSFGISELHAEGQGIIGRRCHDPCKGHRPAHRSSSRSLPSGDGPGSRPPELRLGVQPRRGQPAQCFLYARW